MSLDVLTCDELWTKLLAEGRVRCVPGMRLRANPDAEEEPLPELLVYEVGEPAGRRLYCVDVSECPGKSWQVLGPVSAIKWNDAATLGCLRECARAALGAIHLDVRLVAAGYCEAISYEDRTGNGWDIYGVGQGATVAEALLRAIESAPESRRRRAGGQRSHGAV